MLVVASELSVQVHTGSRVTAAAAMVTWSGAIGTGTCSRVTGAYHFQVESNET